MSRVLIRKLDGIPVEYQSGDPEPGTLIQNIINAGFNSSDYEELEITDENYKSLEETKILKPKRDETKKRRDAALIRIKLKLNLNDKDINDLRMVLRG